MTRKQLLRLLVAIKFGLAGNGSVFRWLLARRDKLPTDPLYWTVRNAYVAFMNESFRQYFESPRPLCLVGARGLSESDFDFSGGTFIQEPLTYGR